MKLKRTVIQEIAVNDDNPRLCSEDCCYYGVECALYNQGLDDWEDDPMERLEDCINDFGIGENLHKWDNYNDIYNELKQLSAKYGVEIKLERSYSEA